MVTCHFTGGAIAPGQKQNSKNRNAFFSYKNLGHKGWSRSDSDGGGGCGGRTGATINKKSLDSEESVRRPTHHRLMRREGAHTKSRNCFVGGSAAHCCSRPVALRSAAGRPLSQESPHPSQQHDGGRNRSPQKQHLRPMMNQRRQCRQAGGWLPCLYAPLYC